MKIYTRPLINGQHRLDSITTGAKNMSNTKQTKYHLLIIHDDTEPELCDWFVNQKERDQFAKEWRARRHKKDGIYRVEITENGDLFIDSFSGDFFDDIDDDTE